MPVPVLGKSGLSIQGGTGWSRSNVPAFVPPWNIAWAPIRPVYTRRHARLSRCLPTSLGRAADMLVLGPKRSGRTVGQWPAAEAINIIRWIAYSTFFRWGYSTPTSGSANQAYLSSNGR